MPVHANDIRLDGELFKPREGEFRENLAIKLRRLRKMIPDSEAESPEGGEGRRRIPHQGGRRRERERKKGRRRGSRRAEGERPFPTKQLRSARLWRAIRTAIIIE
jgi:hypothetical protein